MILSIYTIRDNKSEAYLNPFFLQNDAVAYRAVGDCIADSNHEFSKHIEDYALYFCGTWESSTGEFDMLAAPKHMSNLIDLKGA